MISERRLRDTATLHAARSLAQLLADARQQLPAAARICVRCQHVFTPTHTTDRRCDDCVQAVAEAEAVRL